jgi:hypothetical protein
MSRDLTFLLFVLLMALGMVGNFDYADQIRIEAEKKEHRARLAHPSPAPIYSKRCGSRGRDFHAHQADGGHWVVVCTGRRVLL